VDVKASRFSVSVPKMHSVYITACPKCKSHTVKLKKRIFDQYHPPLLYALPGDEDIPYVPR